MTNSTDAAVPGVEVAVRRLIGDSALASPERLDRLAGAVLDLFAPILAEKAERDAYNAKMSETVKWLDEMADNPPKPTAALKTLFADYKASGIASPLNACCYREQCADWKARALAAEAALAGERERLLEAGAIVRDARFFDEHPVDITIEVDRGFFVITRSSGVIESHHTTDTSALLDLVKSRVEAVRLSEKKQRQTGIDTGC